MPIEIVLSADAEKELYKMDGSVRKIFVHRIAQIAENQPPPTKLLHLNDRIWCVDEIGSEKRLPYYIENGKLYIPHCVKDHKDYDKWWKEKMN